MSATKTTGTTATVCCSATQRVGVQAFKGNPLTLLGPEIKVGQKAPDFQVLAQDLTPVALSKFKGRPLIISVVPSLDTGVCDAQTRRFNEEAAQLPDVTILTISMDLPFAQKRWCGAAGVSKVQVLSDHKDASFGLAFGTLIQELRLLARALFVIDASGAVKYVQYVPEMTTHPDYDGALSVARTLAK